MRTDDELRRHWETAYGRKTPDTVSWYRPHLETSLEFVRRAGLAPDARIIDVGGGASTFVDDLLDDGFRNVTVVDLSATALAAARDRLGARAGDVTWLEGDVTRLALEPGGCDLWHDRAVFHFLTDREDRDRHRAAIERTVAPDGWVIMATFGPEGPERCSGLPTRRSGPDALAADLGADFEPVEHRLEHHATPAGASQQFLYMLFRRRDSCPQRR